MRIGQKKKVIRFGPSQNESPLSEQGKQPVLYVGTRTGIRTPVAALKGLSPRPLDDAGG